MNAGATHPYLRLVGSAVTDEMAQWQRQQQAKNDVTKENRLSAHGTLSPDDPALTLATQVRCELQGPVLSPQRREKLLKSANKLGLRPFQASLVIAVEQDRARLGSNTLPTLPTPPSPESAAARTAHIVEHLANEAQTMFWRWLLAGASALVLAGILIRMLAWS